ncbi:MAG: biotin/lipoyl-binding protein [Candidatus Rokubacteria bacterium]|nr:biotin/lipoyl-binding protein [Candidatus Rokubacteria bacterium]
MMVARRALLVVAAVALFAGCSRTDEPLQGAAAPAEPLAVSVKTIARRPVPRILESMGTVRARRQSVLSSKIVAAVVAVHVVEGQRVRAGDIIATLDDRGVSTQLRRARAAREEAGQALEEVELALRASDRAQEAARAQQELARATLARYKVLLDRELVAAQDYDELAAKARVATADAARLVETHASLAARRRQMVARIEQADAEVANVTVVTGYTKVLAPFDGVVIAKSAEVGERAAQVVEIVPASDPASRTFVVRIDLPTEAALRSGLYGRARFVVGERSSLAVPKTALIERGQLQSVVVVDESQRARLRLVKTGKTAGDSVEILSGLADGERVVVDGAAGLADGRLVEPRE